MRWMVRSAFVLGLAALATSIALGSGTTTITHEKGGSVKKVIFDWLSDASGDVDTTYAVRLNGDVLCIIAVPDTGATAPSDNYDLAFYNQFGAEIAAQGSNLDSATVAVYSRVTAANKCASFANDQARVVVDNAGNANGGQVLIYYR